MLWPRREIITGKKEEAKIGRMGGVGIGVIMSGAKLIQPASFYDQG